MKRKQTVGIWRMVRVVIAVSLIGWGGWSLYQSTQRRDTQQQSSSAMSTAPAGEPTKKSAEQKAAYTVPADHPRQLIIDQLGIDANILPMGITKNDAMQAPASAWDVGWYTKSALPGSDNGSLIIDGHVNDTLGKPGIFAALGSLKKGDSIVIERGDLQRIDYSVVSVGQQPLANVDMVDLGRTPEGASEGVSLITCSGTYDASKQTYTDRTIVRAARKG
jgi:LPXTG-site transpeptidase (sortase) family protein